MKNETQWHMFYQRLWEFFNLISRLYLKTSPQRERGCPSSCVKVFVLAQTHKHWITCLNCSVFEGMMEDSGADSHPLFGSTRVETVVVVQQGMGLHLDEGEPGPGAVADKGRREMWPIAVLSRDGKGRHGGLQETMKKMWFFFFMNPWETTTTTQDLTQSNLPAHEAKLHVQCSMKMWLSVLEWIGEEE